MASESGDLFSNYGVLLSNDTEVRKNIDESDDAANDQIVGTIEKCRQRYISMLVGYPGWYLIVYFIIATALSATGVWIHGNAFEFDPRIGFEARTNELSYKRIAVKKVIDIQTGISPQALKGWQQQRRKRALDFRQLMELSKIFVKTPCDLYDNAGSEIFSYDMLDIFGKIVFRIPSIKTLTDVVTMQRLCEIDSCVKRLLDATNLKQNIRISMKFAFNIPYYSMCYSNSVDPRNCSNLNQQQLKLFVDDLMPCLSDITRESCASKYSQQLSTLIIGTKNRTVGNNEPVYISVILPVTATENLQKFYEALLTELQNRYDDEQLKLVGAFFGVKAPLFAKLIQTDIAYGFLSIALVVLIIFFYASSLPFALCIGVFLLLSIGVAFFVYTVIMGIQFFPFLNLLAIVMIIAVGADDVFLFMYQFDKYLRETSTIPDAILAVDEDDETKKEGNEQLQVIKCGDNVEELKKKLHHGLDFVMSHAAVAMLVTSATTAFAFYANINSNILVLRCFGLYAGTTMILNYVFVITVLPAAIVVFKPKLHPKQQLWLWRAKLCRVCVDCFATVYSRISAAFIVWIPHIVQRMRFAIIPLSFGVLALCIYTIVCNPGIRLPQTNPLQLLRSSHPFEWYDENSADIFEYSDHSKRKMNLVVVWGVNPTKTASTMDPHSLGTLSVDPKFPVFFAKNLQAFADLLRYIAENFGDGEGNGDSLWISEFMQYTQDSDDCNPLLFNSNTSQVNLSELKSCILSYGHNRFMGNPYSDSLLETVDGPIYNNIGDFIGYMLVMQSKFKWSMVFHQMKPFFEHLPQVESAIANFSSGYNKMPLVTGPIKETLLYDLLQTLPTSTTISVLMSLLVSLVVIIMITMNVILSLLSIVSIALVVLLTIATVLWIGWTVNVVEATIIVLSIGMSFDYTLHFAVAFKMHGTSNPRTVYSLVSIPVLLAAVSTFVAGLGLIGAQTQPFFEIGTFLMIVTSTSLLIALFIFPAYVTTFLRTKLKIIKL